MAVAGRVTKIIGTKDKRFSTQADDTEVNFFSHTYEHWKRSKISDLCI